MRLNDVERPIRSYICCLAAAGSDRATADLRLLADFLLEFGTISMVDLEHQWKVVGSNDQKKCEQNSITELGRCLELLLNLLEVAGARVPLLQDLGKLRKFFGEASLESGRLPEVLTALRKAMQPMPIEEQIHDYIRRLHETARTSAFEGVFREISGSELRREHVVEVAKAIYGSVEKRSSRQKALALIRKAHDAYMSAKRGNETTGGRSAA